MRKTPLLLRSIPSPSSNKTGDIPNILQWILFTVFYHIPVVGTVVIDAYSIIAPEYPSWDSVVNVLPCCYYGSWRCSEVV